MYISRHIYFIYVLTFYFYYSVTYFPVVKPLSPGVNDALNLPAAVRVKGRPKGKRKVFNRKRTQKSHDGNHQQSADNEAVDGVTVGPPVCSSCKKPAIL